MIWIDENQEAIARITLAVSEHDKAKQMAAEEEAENDRDKLPPVVAEHGYWRLGSPLATVSAEEWESNELGNHPFNHFEMWLREFLAEFLPDIEQPSHLLKACFFRLGEGILITFCQ